MRSLPCLTHLWIVGLAGLGLAGLGLGDVVRGDPPADPPAPAAQKSDLPAPPAPAPSQVASPEEAPPQEAPPQEAPPPEAAPPAPPRRSPASLPLKFDKVPLGNVARVLSARFSVQVSITANARAPITADFSGMELRPALAEAARQAGLEVTALGSDPSAGFSLAPPEVKADAVAADAAPSAPPPDSKAELEAAARQREELQRQRERLQEQSGHPGSDPAT